MPRSSSRGGGPQRRPGRSRTRRDDPVPRLRAICLALPEANERLSHGEPTWFAGKGKVFAMLDDHHHGGAHLSAWLPAGPGAQEALIDSDPDRFFRPPYVGARGGSASCSTPDPTGPWWRGWSSRRIVSWRLAVW
jgi:hypothetical protein